MSHASFTVFDQLDFELLRSQKNTSFGSLFGSILINLFHSLNVHKYLLYLQGSHPVSPFIAATGVKPCRPIKYRIALFFTTSPRMMNSNKNWQYLCILRVE